MIKTPHTSKCVPLTNDELRRLRGSDLVRLNLSDDEISRLRIINKERERIRLDFSDKFRFEEAPIIKDLELVGLNVNSVWDLVGATKPYPEAVSILLKHLVMKYSDRIKEGIARALAVPDARGAWALIAAEYLRTVEGQGQEGRLGAKDGLAAALSATATDAVIEKLASMVRDPSNGDSRLFLLSALRKSKTEIAINTLKEVSDDPALKMEIASWRTRD